MKNLISTLAIAGSLVLGGCGENKEVKQISELEKYNLENKTLHEDFMKFCKENPNKKEYAGIYKIDFSNKDYSVIFDENGSFLDINAETNFHDEKGNGLEGKSSDLLSFRNKENRGIEVKYIRDLSPEKQLESAKEYDAFKRKILHDSKYKTY